MIKQVDFFYCDRCGCEMSNEQYISENCYVDKISSVVRHICPKCYAEYKPKEQELLNWLEMNGKALAVKSII